MAESHSPQPAGGYIRILAVPTSWLDALTVRDSCFYRFEYHLSEHHLWSAVSFSGESFYPRRASVTWKSDSTATVYLDDNPYFQLQDRLWHAIK